MAAENRFNGAVTAFQAGFNRVAARIAALSFWQFVLLAIILLAAAGISEGLFWDKPAKRRIQSKAPSATASADKRDAKSRDKGSITAEIHIDQDGLVIRRKAAPEDKSALPSTPASDADKPSAAAPAPGAAALAQDHAAPAPDKSSP